MGQTRVRGRLVTPAGVLEDGLVAVSGGVVEYVGPAVAMEGARPGEGGGRHHAEVGPPPLDAPPDGFVLPGLVDVHNHGGGGASFTTGQAADVGRAARHHREHGTTAVIASTVTDRTDSMLAAIAAAAGAADSGEVAGIHVEGPFLARGRCGAQDPRHVRAPDLGLALDLLDAGRGHVRAMTLAPELPGASGVVRALLERGVVPALGHTEADAGRLRRTLAEISSELGRPGLVTHLFNGMPLLHHRDPGPAAGALAAAAADHARVELIADGVHLDDETVRMVFALLGPDRVVLVTDAMAAAGMPDGEYALGSQRARVRDGVARLDSADAPLAGGTSCLLDVVRRCVGAGVDLAAAVAAATRSPAAAVGLEGVAGSLSTGRSADLVVTDGDLRPVQVMRQGRWVSG